MNILEARCTGLARLLVALVCLGGVGPQRLCASVDANTSARPVAARTIAFTRTAGTTLAAALTAVPDDPAIQPKPIKPQSDDPAQPAARPAAPVRIALLLPMRSDTLATAAESVRAGFMASVERDGTGFKVEVVSTGDAPRDVLDAYAHAAAASDIVVGPLARSAVAALADSDAVTRPTVALSVPEGHAAVPRALPRRMLVAGLSIEDEAKQVAEWAAREHPQGRALILTGGAAWAQRAAGAFEARWNELGHTNQRFAVPSGEAGKAAIAELKQKLEIDPPDLLFAALDGTGLRAVRAGTTTAIPCYGGGSANPGRAAGEPGASPLDGVRILDLPWIVLPDHPAVMVYPRPPDTEQPLDMDRLYALGIDAFRVARELALRGGAPFGMDGVTGRLDAVANPGGRLELRRREAAVVVRNGGFEPVDSEH
ncbi:MAG: penicillin-binding protein activator [Massilia sp.]|nr:penicillin-binding protein activator [Massilia sp.]